MKLTKEQKKRYINVFEGVLKLLNEGEVFICCLIHDIGSREEGSEEQEEWFKSQKPTNKLHTKFYNHKAFRKDNTVWWQVFRKDEYEDSMGFVSYNHKQRQLFVKHLINILKHMPDKL